MTRQSLKWCTVLCTFILFSLISLAASAQVKVTGTVVDDAKLPLIGVSVVEKGTTNGTMTDLDGNYSLTVANANVTLVFTYVGFDTQSIPLKGRTAIDVTMMQDAKLLDEIIVVGYGVQNKGSVTAAISQIDGEKLLKAPTANLTNMLGGLVPGVTSLQPSGQPGADQASLKIRGMAPKYIVDGIERKIGDIDPRDVETVSVLKDASAAAVYGLDGNTVVIITTKRGKSGESRISFTAEYGISTNAKMLQMLDGPQYAYWYNKARELDGDAPIFGDEHVRNMLSGTNGWGNTNWYKKTFGTGHNASYNVNATGGSEKIKYFTSIGGFNQEGNVDNFDYNRINLRSNIDAEIASNLTFAVNILGRIEKRKAPGYSASPNDWNNIPQQALRAHPYLPEYHEGLPVGSKTASVLINPNSATNNSGYNNSRTTVLETNMSLKYDTPFIKGLSAKFMVSYDATHMASKIFASPYEMNQAMLPDGPTGQISYVRAPDPRGTETTLTEGSTHHYTVTTNTSLDYSNTFGKHSISGILLAETYQHTNSRMQASAYGFDFPELDELDNASKFDKVAPSGMTTNRRKVGFVGRASYEYDNRYLAELSGRFDGTDTFSGMTGGKRWRLTPALSLGWRMSNEEFFKDFDTSDIIDDVKFRFGVGETASSGINPYTYLSTLSYYNNSSPVAIIGGAPQLGLIYSRPANTEITWVKNLQYNVGLDFTLWRGLLSAEFDVFYKYTYDLIRTRDGNDVPSSWGGYFNQYDNNDRQDTKGFEVSLTHRHKIGDFSYSVNVMGTYAKSRWLRHSNDPINAPDWLKLTGKEVGMQVGFLSDGLFQSQEEIDNSPLIAGKAVRVGDIKYIDRNGDGVISYEYDRGYVGKPSTPRFMGSMQITGDWRGFDFSMVFVSGLGRDVALTGLYSSGVMDHTSMTRPFYHGGNSPAYLLERSWTPENTNADFPRLSLVPASSNNAYASDYWYKNGNYLRMKSAQIGYTIPANLLKAAKIHQLRIYMDAQNLFTISGLNKFNVDPEQPGVSNGYYPQQRIFAGGVKLTF